MDSFTCIDWSMSLLTAARKCTAVLKNCVAFCFLIMMANSILDRQWHGTLLWKMDLNRITLFLGDEKINYFSIPCSAKHSLKVWALWQVSFLFFFEYSFLASWSVVLGSTASVSPGNMLEMQNFGAPGHLSWLSVCFWHTEVGEPLPSVWSQPK